MITGMPLSGIGLLRQAAIEGAARAEATRGDDAPAAIALEIELAALPPDADAAVEAAPERRRIDVLV